LFKIIQDGKKNPPGGNAPAPAETNGRGKPGWVKRFFAPPGRPKEVLSEANVPATPAAAGEKKSWFSQAKIQGAETATAIFASPINLREQDIKAINKILAVICIAVTALVFYYLINKRPNIVDITGRPYDAPFPRKSKETMQAFKPLSFYMDSVKKRDIFRLPPEKKDVKAASAEGKEAAAKKLKQLIGGLKLQGISWGASPKAMVKDELDGQVYFLKEGEAIGTSGIKIKTISKDKVIVGYKKEEMELL